MASQNRPRSSCSAEIRTYGDTVVQDNGVAILGNVQQRIQVIGGNHSHFHVHEIELLHEVIKRCRPVEISVEARERTLLQLDTLARVLEHAGEIASLSGQGERGHAETLQVIAGSTARALKDFHANITKLRDYNVQSRRAGKEIQNLQQYLTGQLLCLNGALHLLQHEVARSTVQETGSRHEQVFQRFDLHDKAIEDLKHGLRPIAQVSELNRATLVQLAKQSSSTTKALLGVQQSISRSPVFGANNCINFLDALERPYKLPFTFFETWQTFEGFLHNKFEYTNIPGGHHVKNGSYLISPKADQSRALTKANWKTMVYPGCNLTMSIVFTILRLSVLTCPREGCGWTPSQMVEEGSFISCSRCGLTYRYDRSVELPLVAHEDQRIEEAQQEDDLRRFGQRCAPADVAELPETSALNNETATQQHAYGLPDPRLYEFDVEMEDVKPSAPFTTQTPNSIPPTPSAIDWNAGKSGLEAWLNTSAMPTNERPPEKDEYEQALELRMREIQDLKSLKRIHFIELAPETKPLVQSLPQYRQMPLESQVYVRKIADKFPALPMVLVERFAKASVARKNRLKGLRIHDESIENQGVEDVTANAAEPIQILGLRRRRDHETGYAEAADHRKKRAREAEHF